MNANQMKQKVNKVLKEQLEELLENMEAQELEERIAPDGWCKKYPDACVSPKYGIPPDIM